MWRRVVESKLFTLAGLAGLVFFGLAFTRRLPDFRSIRQDVARMEARIMQAGQDRDALSLQEHTIGSEAYLDRQARLQLNYKKPGEEVVYVYHTGELQEASVTLAKKQSNLQKWWDYLVRD